jgi:hypothetical protein
MTKRSYGDAIATLVLGLVPTAAFAQTRHTPHVAHSSSGPRSYLDVDDNGTWSSPDTKLPAPIAPGVLYANLSKAGDRAGAVLGDGVPATTIIAAPGDIHVTASLGVNQLNLSSSGGDIYIDAGVHLSASKYGVVLDAPRGTIHIGDGATLTAGDGSTVHLAAPTVEVGNNVTFTAPSVMGSVTIIAPTTSFGTGDAFITPTSGVSQDTSVNISSCAVNLSHASIAAEVISVKTRSSLCPEAGGIAITNSSLKLDNDSNAMLDLFGPSVNLQGTTITPKQFAPAS